MNLKRLDWILVKAGEASTLTAWEEAFINDFVERREKYGDKLLVSERQEEILERIGGKE